MSDLELIRDGRHYDALKTQNDVAFYLAQAQATAGSVLEIGCGTGRVTIPLAAAGVDITGLDVSASMLEEAKRKADSQGLRIDWVAADGRSFDLGRRFSLIMMPFNTLQFFRDDSGARAAFPLREEPPWRRGAVRFQTSSTRRCPSSPPIRRPAMSERVTRTRMGAERSSSRKRGSTLPSGKSYAQPATIMSARKEASR